MLESKQQVSRLVFTRTSGESFCIGDDVEVEIVEIGGGKVRLAVTAPRTVSVDRKEIRQRKKKGA